MPRSKPIGSGRPKSSLSTAEKQNAKRDYYEPKGGRAPPQLRGHEFKRVYEKIGEDERGIGRYKVEDEDALKELRKKKEPVMTKEAFENLRRKQNEFQIENMDFFNEKASGLGALPLYKTPEDDTVANYQEMPYCGLDKEGNFYYPHVKVTLDPSGKYVLTKKVTCRKKVVKDATLGKKVPSKKITGASKNTVTYILNGFGANEKKRNKLRLRKLKFDTTKLLRLLKDEDLDSDTPTEASLRQIPLPELRQIVIGYWDQPKDYVSELTKSDLVSYMINYWSKRDPSSKTKIRRENPTKRSSSTHSMQNKKTETKSEVKSTTAKRSRKPTTITEGKKNKSKKQEKSSEIASIGKEEKIPKRMIREVTFESKFPQGEGATEIIPSSGKRRTKTLLIPARSENINLSNIIETRKTKGGSGSVRIRRGSTAGSTPSGGKTNLGRRTRSESYNEEGSAAPFNPEEEGRESKRTKPS